MSRPHHVPKQPSRAALRYIRHHFIYNSANGEIRWKNLAGRQLCRANNGDLAGTLNKINGYRLIYFRLAGKKLTLKAHNVAWYLFHRVWPQCELDHRDTIKTNNRISNLREASHSQNGRNRGLQANNTSGVVGVHLHSNGLGYIAQIKYKQRNIYLGYFTAIEQAIAVRKIAEKRYFGRWRFQR